MHTFKRTITHLANASIRLITPDVVSSPLIGSQHKLYFFNFLLARCLSANCHIDSTQNPLVSAIPTVALIH